MEAVNSTIIQNVTISFSWYDYIIFSVMLCFSALIGIYFGCFGTKQSSADEYLMGNHRMKVIPISISLVASHVSGITLLAVPADIYRYGAGYWLLIPAVLVVLVCLLYIYLPVFYKLQITSTYEYLERRFDSTNRTFASFLFTLGLFLYLPIVIYIPALAFSAATGIKIHYITPLVCGVCIFYTTLGGLKAVVWTDTLQFTITTGALFTVVVIGVKSAGGFGNIWATALEGHRLDVFDFDPDPTKRDSFFTVIIGLSVGWFAATGIHQSCVQKFLSVSTYHESQLTAIYFCIGIIIVSSFSVFTGLIMYARYAKCDPFTLGLVQTNDQLLPYYIMDVASHIPGLSGLFIAGIFCAALSTLSANLNCLAGTMYEDFIQKWTGPQDQTKAAHILKILVVITGVVSTALVFVVEHLGSILSLAISFYAVTSGPLLGMFTLGVLFPKASSKGTFYGALLSLLVTGWIVVMVQYYRSTGYIADISKPTSIEECSALAEFINSTEPTLEGFNYTTPIRNFTVVEDFVANLTQMTEEAEGSKPFVLFRLSHYYHSPLAFSITVFAGLLFSYLLGNDDPPVHRDLLSPVIYFLLPDEKKLNEKDYYSLDKALNLVTTNHEKGCQDKIQT